MRFQVSRTEGRLDKYLSVHLDLSREQIKEGIKSGLITVNQGVSKPAYILQEGDVIDCDDSLFAVADVRGLNPTELPLDILAEDDDVLVLNKPSGLVVHPGVKTMEPTLVEGLLHYCPDIASVGESDRPGIVHRLDRYTEGVMVIAKTQHAYDSLKAQFQNHHIDKAYYAMVQGDLPWEEFVCDEPLERHPKKRHLRWVVPDGKSAKTSFRVLERYNTKTLIEAVPTTGRTHQIRVHLAYLGFPVIGDKEYGKGREDGQLLQAFRLGFKHPTSGKNVVYSLPKSEVFS